MPHAYKVGQMLDLLPARHSTRPAGPCQVVTCMPHEGGAYLYRVNSVADGNEWVIDETDLSPSSASKPDTNNNVTPFTIAIKKRAS